MCCSMWSTGGVLFYVEHWWCVVLCGALVVCCSMWSTGGVFYVEHWWCVVLFGAHLLALTGDIYHLLFPFLRFYLNPLQTHFLTRQCW